jgi:membrane protease YdiL (CAAX protease family)
VGDPVTVTSAPPGWYADPWRQTEWRWWDGGGWTGFTDQTYAATLPSWNRDPNASPGELRAGGIAILGFLVGLGVSTVVGIFLLLAGYDTSDPAFLLGSTLGLWFGLGGSCLVAVRSKGTGSLRDLGLVPPRWVDLALGAGFAIVGIITVSVVGAALQAIDKNLVPSGRSDLVDPASRDGLLGIAVIYLIAVVGAPFFEELYFRGLVQGTLTARGGFGVGVVVQALLFGLVHLDPKQGWGNVGTFVIITIVGLGLGTIRRYSGRLPPGMFTHAGYNAIIVTLALATK